MAPAGGRRAARGRVARPQRLPRHLPGRDLAGRPPGVPGGCLQPGQRASGLRLADRRAAVPAVHLPAVRGADRDAAAARALPGGGLDLDRRPARPALVLHGSGLPGLPGTCGRAPRTAAGRRRRRARAAAADAGQHPLRPGQRAARRPVPGGRRPSPGGVVAARLARRPRHRDQADARGVLRALDRGPALAGPRRLRHHGGRRHGRDRALRPVGEHGLLDGRPARPGPARPERRHREPGTARHAPAHRSARGAVAHADLGGLRARRRLRRLRGRRAARTPRRPGRGRRRDGDARVPAVAGLVDPPHVVGRPGDRRAARRRTTPCPRRGCRRRGRGAVQPAPVDGAEPRGRFGLAARARLDRSAGLLLAGARGAGGAVVARRPAGRGGAGRGAPSRRSTPRRRRRRWRHDPRRDATAVLGLRPR